MVRTIPDMAEAFQGSVGLSDHTLGTRSANHDHCGGGVYPIEKHLTLRVTLRPRFCIFIEARGVCGNGAKAVQVAEQALGGKVRYEPAPRGRNDRIFPAFAFAVETS